MRKALNYVLALLAVAAIGVIVYALTGNRPNTALLIAAAVQGLAAIALVYVANRNAQSVDAQVEASRRSAAAMEESVALLMQERTRESLEALHTLKSKLVHFRNTAQNRATSNPGSTTSNPIANEKIEEVEKLLVKAGPSVQEIGEAVRGAARKMNGRAFDLRNAAQNSNESEMRQNYKRSYSEAATTFSEAVLTIEAEIDRIL